MECDGRQKMRLVPKGTNRNWMYCNVKVVLWNVVRGNESNIGDFEHYGSQHDYMIGNVMSVYKWYWY